MENFIIVLVYKFNEIGQTIYINKKIHFGKAPTIWVNEL